MHAIYGAPSLLRGLAEFSAEAVQLSPLLPNSKRLEDLSLLDSLVLLAPPGTIERRYTLALALDRLAPGARLTALGPKDKGGARIKKELLEFGCEVEEESRSHQKICVCNKPREKNQALQNALLAGAPRFDENLGMHTQPGVFSWDRIDTGSELLAGCLPSFSGTGTDLGAGIGFLSREILSKSPQVQKLTLLELDRRAVECAALNIKDKRADIIWHDVRTPLELQGLDFVVTNPPFHDGGKEDQDLGRIFIKQAAHILKPRGVLWLVANKHLPYEDVLKSLFSSLEIRAEREGFKIYEAIR